MACWTNSIPSLSLPGGPVRDDQTTLILRNDTDDVLELDAGTEVGILRSPDPDEVILMEGYSDLDANPPASSPDIDGILIDLDEPSAQEPVDDKNGMTYVNADTCDHPPLGVRRKSPWWIRWAMIILLLLASGSGWKPNIPVINKQCSSNNNVNKHFTNAHDPLYKAALMQRLEEHRHERYAHLSEARFRLLQQLVADFSDVLIIDGMLGGVVEGYEFDTELVPNAKPVRHQLPKMSTREVEKEQYHINKAEKLGHLRVPTDEQKVSGVQKHMWFSEKVTTWVDGSVTSVP